MVWTEMKKKSSSIWEKISASNFQYLFYFVLNLLKKIIRISNFEPFIPIAFKVIGAHLNTEISFLQTTIHRTKTGEERAKARTRIEDIFKGKPK